MEKNQDGIINHILNLFGKSFLIYNAVVFLLMLPCGILACSFENSFFRMLLIMDFLLILINAVYILCNTILNRRSIFAENEAKSNMKK